MAPKCPIEKFKGDGVCDDDVRVLEIYTAVCAPA